MLVKFNWLTISPYLFSHNYLIFIIITSKTVSATKIILIFFIASNCKLKTKTNILYKSAILCENLYFNLRKQVKCIKFYMSMLILIYFEKIKLNKKIILIIKFWIIYELMYFHIIYIFSLLNLWWRFVNYKIGISFNVKYSVLFHLLLYLTTHAWFATGCNTTAANHIEPCISHNSKEDCRVESSVSSTIQQRRACLNIQGVTNVMVFF